MTKPKTKSKSENEGVTSKVKAGLIVLAIGGFFTLSWGYITDGRLIQFLGGVTDKQSIAAGAVPSGAVLIMDSDACPSGWKNLASDPVFSGRIVVPTGGTRGYRQTGGTNSVVLSLAQIPMHSHKPPAKEGTISGPGLSLKLEGLFTSAGQTVLVPDNAAASKERMAAISNSSSPMAVDLTEPFVALHFCKKG